MTTSPGATDVADSPLPRPVPQLVGARGYRRRALPASVDLRLDGNEGALPDPTLADAVSAAGPELLRRYPSSAAIESRIAESLGVAPDSVLVLAGGDEILDRTFRAFVGADRVAIIPEPSFEMLPVYARIAGCRTVHPVWRDGPYPIEAVRAAIDGERRRDDTGNARAASSRSCARISGPSILSSMRRTFFASS